MEMQKTKFSIKSGFLEYSCINCIHFIVAFQRFAFWKIFEIVNIQNPTPTVCFGLFSFEWGGKLKKSGMM